MLFVYWNTKLPTIQNGMNPTISLISQMILMTFPALFILHEQFPWRGILRGVEKCQFARERVL